MTLDMRECQILDVHKLHNRFGSRSLVSSQELHRVHEVSVERASPPHPRSANAPLPRPRRSRRRRSGALLEPVHPRLVVLVVLVGSSSSTSSGASVHVLAGLQPEAERRLPGPAVARVAAAAAAGRVCGRRGGADVEGEVREARSSCFCHIDAKVDRERRRSIEESKECENK